MRDLVCMARCWMKVKAWSSAMACWLIRELFGLFDEASGLQLVLGDRADLFVDGQGALFKGGPQHLGHGRDQLGLAEGLDQVGRHARVASLLDEVALAEGGEQEHRDVVARADLTGRRDAIEAGHLHVEHGEIRAMGVDERHSLVPPTGLGHDHVAGFLEDLLEVEADDGLVVSDDDP